MDVTTGEGTPAASPAALETKSEDHGAGAPAAADVTAGDGRSDDKRAVDSARLNKLIADSKELKDLKASVASSNETTQNRLQAAADALTGSQGTASKSEMDALADEYNVPIDYLKKQNSLVAKMVKAELQAELAPLKKGQEDLNYQRQVVALSEKFPEVESLTKDEQKELRELAYKKEYLNVPLEAVYGQYVLNRPEGRPKTFESGSNGRRSASDNKDIGQMTDEEFMEYSSSLENRKKNRA